MLNNYLNRKIQANYGFLQVSLVGEDNFIMLKIDEDIICDWLTSKAFLSLKDAERLRDELTEKNRNAKSK